MKIFTKTFLLSVIFLLSSLITVAQNEATNAPESYQAENTDVTINNGTRGTLAVGDVISTVIPSGLSEVWGIGFDRSTNLMYLTDYTYHPTTIFEYDLAGNPTGNTITISVGQVWIGDMAIENGYLYAVMVGAPNNIQVVDLSTGNVVNAIGGAFTTISQRGLAYDASANEFYIGGWNQDIIYHVDGSGNPIDQFSFGGISGLEWHPNGGPSGQGSLWVVTNESTGMVTELDPKNGWATLQSFVMPGTAAYGGAGLALNSNGNLWVANQKDDAVYETDSGEALFPATVPIGASSIVLAVLLIGSFLFIKRGKLL